MDYNQATLYAAKGYTLILPGWHGYFKWDFQKKELYFQDKDYYLSEEQLKEKRVRERKDWYYII